MARSAPASEPLAKVLAEIGRGRVPPIVVTRFDPREGEDLFARDRLLSEIRRAVLGEAPAVFAETVFGAASIGLVEILDAAREVSLMAPRRLVLVRGSRVEGGSGGSTTDEPARKRSREDESCADRDVEAERGDAGESADQSGPAEGAPRAGAAGSGRAGASAQTRAGAAAPAPAVRDEDAATLAVLDRYMAGAAKSACIAFLGCSWDGRRRIHKAVLAAATVVDTSRPDAREVPAWVSNLVRQGGGRIASDAAVPYRTSARLVATYTSREVARVLAEDFERHGTPLVMRMDRASPHDAESVLEVLRRHEVLMLHGPARYPQYYGQHERQNREHQAWLAHSERVDDAELAEMMRVLNERWPRPSLAWRPSAALWHARRPLRTNRRELRRDVVRRAAQLRARLGMKTSARRLAERLAIEQALEDRGLLRRIAGGW